jgi:hypothetical protein
MSKHLNNFTWLKKATENYSIEDINSIHIIFSDIFYSFGRITLNYSKMGGGQ